MPNNLLNTDLLQLARFYSSAAEKRSFVDPAMASGAAMDPAMGGMPPEAAAGGAMPADPGAMPPGAGVDPMMIRQMVTQEVQQAMGSGGTAGGGGIKPKIDINVALMQISKMLARIADTLGISIPASEMIATPTDLNQMASQQQTASQPQSAISPISPIQAASPELAKQGGYYCGEPYSDSMAMSSKASAVAALIRRRDY